MFGIPLPYIALAVLIALFGSYRGGYHFGWEDRDKEMQIQIAKKNEEARQTEQKLNEQLNANAAKLQETTNVINEKQSALDRAIRAGRVRISAPSCPQASPNAASPAGDSNTTQTESEREVIAALIDIAAEGDKAITKLNSCISAYNEVRTLVNGQ